MTEGRIISFIEPEDSQDSSELLLAGIDADSGAEEWRLTTSLSGATRVSAPPLLSDLVIVTVPSTHQAPWVHLVAINGSGREVARLEEPVAVYALPWACLDDRVCFRGYVGDDENYTDWQVTLDEGQLRVGEHTSTSSPVSASDGIVVRRMDVEGVETMRGLDADGVVWERPLVELELPRGRVVAGSTRKAAGVYIADLYYSQEDEVGELPLQDHPLLALDLETGAELWRRNGAGLCGGAADEESDVVLVCEGTGAARVDYDTGTLNFDGTNQVTLSGVVESTGEELWSIAITGSDWTAMNSELSRPVDSKLETVQQRGDVMVVDPQTGEALSGGSASVPDGFRCFRSRLLGQSEEKFRSDHLLFTCGLDGKPQNPPTARALEVILKDPPHELDVVAGPDGISRYP
ncbi:hypothetical protein [Serinicoccus marinus]|uniref:hypothetical protein n=1 Tax=Serinicoccus marinus TaxID=247333 RepID=UPI0003B3FF7D|nr:hypothetical protein [Serinicoccus marinus]